MTDSTEVDTQFDTPGSLLSQARNAKGFTAADIAQKLRLKVGIIEALERDEVLSTISLTFTKGYVRSYAKLLGLNENHIIQLFNELHISDDLTPKKMQSFSRKVSREHNDSRWMIVTYSIIALVILLSILWWVQHQSEPFFAAKSNVPEAEQSVSESLQTPVFDAIEDDSFTLNAVEIDSELTDLTNATEAEAEVEIETGSDLAPYEQAEFADETTTAIPDFIPNTNPENINQVLTVLENNDPDVESELRLFADDNESMQD
ncbi:MAG TPA: hypothetical protein DCR37_06835, partial [Glaciecola sp.]|nr:hypothetical protein [Glaciecola sp.]